MSRIDPKTNTTLQFIPVLIVPNSYPKTYPPWNFMEENATPITAEIR